MLVRLKAEVHRLEGLMREKISPLWTEYLKPTLDASIKANQAALDNILDSQVDNSDRDFANCKALRGSIRAYQNIFNEVENTQKVIEQKRERIEQIASELKTIEEEGQL